MQIEVHWRATWIFNGHYGHQDRNGSNNDRAAPRRRFHREARRQRQPVGLAVRAFIPAGGRHLACTLRPHTPNAARASAARADLPLRQTGDGAGRLQRPEPLLARLPPRARRYAAILPPPLGHGPKAISQPEGDCLFSGRGKFGQRTAQDPTRTAIARACAGRSATFSRNSKGVEAAIEPRWTRTGPAAAVFSWSALVQRRAVSETNDLLFRLQP